MNIITPALSVKSLNEINLKKYWDTGKRGIILDLDNTITPWNEMELSQEARSFLKEARTLNYKIFLLTNAQQKRTEAIAQKYAVSYLAPAFKPRKAGFLKALTLMDLKSEQVLVIGDQIFTDIFGGNRVGCYTILVPPISQKEFFGTKFLRLLETFIRK